MINIIIKNTGSKLSIWFRNYHTDHLEKKDIYTKFYHTYINPFNDENKLSYEDYKKLNTNDKRRLLIENYKQFDKETKNILSLYDFDDKEIRTKKNFETKQSDPEIVKKIEKQIELNKKKINNKKLKN